MEIGKQKLTDSRFFSFPISVANIRNHLAAAVPASDQILLLGPPYKVPRDSTLQSLEILSSLRLGDKEDEDSMNGGIVATAISKEDEDGASSNKQKHRNKQQILSITERSGARRLFLFSKRALSENAPDPPPCILKPMDVVHLVASILCPNSSKGYKKSRSVWHAYTYHNPVWSHVRDKYLEWTKDWSKPKTSLLAQCLDFRLASLIAFQIGRAHV